MKEIKLTQGKVALVDDADYEWLSKYNWCYINSGYAVSASMIWEYKVRGLALMHRVILNVPSDKFIDHINGNKLDNRRENLRIASFTENMRNRPAQSNNTSGYKGVVIRNREKKNSVAQDITARIKVNDKYIHIGTFKTKEEAAKAYNEAALKYFGEFASLNQI